MLTLLNIVSAIYGDPTLGSNMRFVVSRLVVIDGFQGEEEDELGAAADSSSSNLTILARDPIVEGNSKQSLANVNRQIRQANL